MWIVAVVMAPPYRNPGTRLWYAISLPERTVRALVGALGGLIHESVQVLLPRFVRTSRLYEATAKNALRIAAAGAHPIAAPESLEVVQEPRYLEMLAYAGHTARRQGVNGLHVHVGMPDADACMQALEFALPWLPVLLAL